jgi:hypothetical protein
MRSREREPNRRPEQIWVREGSSNTACHRRVARALEGCPAEPLPLLHEWPLRLPDWAPALTKIQRWMDE